MRLRLPTFWVGRHQVFWAGWRLPLWKRTVWKGNWSRLLERDVYVGPVCVRTWVKRFRRE